jgi:hypothetical protein
MVAAPTPVVTPTSSTTKKKYCTVVTDCVCETLL